ncbi:MAG: hypothetical protein WCD42_10085 [Rhizomicrobium sp.]
MPGCIVVLDIGKTLAKITLWSSDQRMLGRKTRPNASVAAADGYASLDAAGIEAWVAESLRDFSRQEKIAAIIPVAHGAAACIVADGALCVAPLDYEAELPADVRADYLALRDPFQLTGSPCLPAGLNLGAQLFWLDQIAPDRARSGTIVTWPQYWAYRLSGVAATEVTSLGCHSDLWLPLEGMYSPLAVVRGWAARMAPLHRAGDVLGAVTAEWRERCGLPADCVVYCGLHDSNAALLAVRGHAEIGTREHTVLSTGTWFIAMRTIGAGARLDMSNLPEACDCLVNVDAFGAPVPSARFMGGRELNMLEGAAEDQINARAAARALYAAAADIVESNTFALPCFQPGVGPVPDRKGTWIERPNYQLGRRAAADLYLALMTDMSLDLIGSKERLVIEGRFAEDDIFCRALASLRPKQQVYLMPAYNSVSYGAMRLVNPDLPPEAALTKVEPLAISLSQYAARWYQLIQQTDAAA